MLAGALIIHRREYNYILSYFKPTHHEDGKPQKADVVPYKYLNLWEEIW